MELTIICFWLAFCFLVGFWADKWGQSGAGYFLFALLCSPLLAALVLMVQGQNVKAVEQKQLQATAMKKCPYCAELIRPEAIKCRFCGSELPPPQPSS